MKGKKPLLLGSAFLIGLSGWLQASDVGEAESISELENELDDIRESQQETGNDGEEAEEDLEGVEEELAKIEGEIREMDEEMSATVEEVGDKEAESAELEEENERLQNEITELEERIEERDEMLKERAVTLYQNGGGTVEYIEVLLGAQSFGDFIDRIRTLSTIAGQDQEILDEHIADHEQLEENKKAVEENLATLESTLAELETLQANLDEQIEDKEVVMDGLDEEQRQLFDDLEEVENKEEILQQQEIAKQNEIEREEERVREREQEKEQERKQEKDEQGEQEAGESGDSGNNEENDLKESEGSDDNSGGSSSSPSTANVSDSGSDGGDGSGTLARPASGPLTSEYGPRWGRMHNGIDIGGSGVPVHSAESGTVSYVGYMSGFGNTVMVTHQMNGQTITTLYAHLASSNVSEGDSVDRSEQIGIMGNTGNTTGPHLHFEVHEGGWAGSGVNSVDPMNYL
ncbi:peptidoglycan DD-metalloendopeptidase family protein [Salicibibacter cibi]|uniref:Peptidoglycan DD-metalloendopeptidase family protein n=1 Tax=Salicibibacter cibi TaxID=2743001 RepID=A0A7T6ZDT4_9BACI|nr:M23 family metallopeptidase [Salicibibacter cibi]QQK81561.1 peptidoglycan DD-metalloendopeptidase family protein [Salicibibacter cibi]